MTGVGDFLYLIIAVAVVLVVARRACWTSAYAVVAHASTGSADGAGTDRTARTEPEVADRTPETLELEEPSPRRWSVRRARRAGSSASAQRLSRSQGALGRGPAGPALAGPARRGHVGGDRGHAAHRGHRRRPDPGARRAAAHPDADRGRRGRTGRPGAAGGAARARRPHASTARWPCSGTTAAPPSSSWSASTAPARPRPSASWPGSWSPRTSRCVPRCRRHLPRRGGRAARHAGASGSACRPSAAPEGSDPASVAFEAARTGVEQEADVVVIDTAGRLQNKAGLMDELGKVKRVVEKQAPVTEVLLVLDATTGQNGMIQARVFSEVVNVTGIVLTKLDGSAKGGIVVAVQRELERAREARRPRRGRRRPGAVRPGGVRRRAPGRRRLTRARRTGRDRRNMAETVGAPVIVTPGPETVRPRCGHSETSVAGQRRAAAQPPSHAPPVGAPTETPEVPWTATTPGCSSRPPSC